MVLQRRFHATSNQHSLPENNISSSCSTVFHNQSKDNLITSQSSASTLNQILQVQTNYIAKRSCK
ncbi:hypothetical protein DEO72_LG1g2094 [Vigna unguiculata]|uniref:Uncharacterized protein n=1 Tax=Vigna unguiculata TaxID=3917 RepID=A0A4D6KVG2_VIGUN|nr:hypothetical protein DEO72_LG1g2094 [Vigna unguiculata]